MKHSLAWASLSIAMALAAACSSSDDGGGGSSSGSTTGDGGPTADGSSGGTDGATGDALASQDAATDGTTDGATEDADASVVPGTFALTSTAFAANASIPAVHTCNGTNVSPPLTWTDAPVGTQSYAVVVRDLSLGAMPNYHWVIYDIPAATTSLAQGVEKDVASPPVPAGAKQTYWSFSTDYGYRGPCPPSLHDYQFTVYSFATATIPVGAPGTDPAAADVVIQANKTGSASLTGKYMQ